MILKSFSQRQFYVELLQILCLAVMYFVTGKLGNLLAIPPGYATAIFPPSGIALAGILLYGYRMGWGVFLGSLLFNGSLFIALNNVSANLAPIFIALGIAGGSALQAIAGAYLVKRFVGFPHELSGEQDILRFLFYGGAVSALINSTLSVSLLVALGRVPLESFLANWGTWWGGDTLGILIFTPLILVWLSSNHKSWQRKKLVITLPIVTMFCLTVAAVCYEVHVSNERIKFEFKQHTDALSVALQSSITTHLNVLRFLNSFYAASKNIDKKEFQTFVVQSLGDFQGVQALGWNRYVSAAERQIYEKSMQQEGYPNFQITERNADKNLVRAGERQNYLPVTFIEPYKGNESAIGYDISSNALRREALDRARDSGELAMTARIKLVQEKGTQNGFLAFMPIYHNDSPHQTVEERRDSISSYVTAVFRGNDIVAAGFQNQDLAGLSYRLIDKSADETEQLIFASNEDDFPALFKNGLINSTIFPVGGRFWQLDVVPTPAYFFQHKSGNAWFILFGGLLLTTLTVIFVLVAAGRQRQLQQLVDDRTATNEELGLMNYRLAAVNEELLFQSAEKEKRVAELIVSNEENKVLNYQIQHMQKLESIGRLTSGIAHDFNNILACILGYNEMNRDVSSDMTDELLKTELETNTKHIDSAGKRAIALIQKMLTYCRQDTIKKKMDVKPTREVISEVLEMLRPALTSRINLEFANSCSINHNDCGTCSVRSHCDDDIQIDAIDLHQILTNLAVNARDAMKERGGIITISLHKIHIQNVICLACADTLTGDFIELSTLDNGTGIEQSVIARIFDPFFTTKPQGEGTGLGLSTVSGMVHQSNGHILVDSTLGEGTAFRLLFPISTDV